MTCVLLFGCVDARSRDSLIAASPSGRSVFFLADNHPRYTELIDQRSVADRKEVLFERYAHCAAGCQCIKCPFRLRRASGVERNREALWLLIAIGRSVRAQ